MLQINIITLFPSLIEPHLKELPFKKAISLNKLKVNIINLRDFALDEYGTVDSKPYGGGVGMLLRIEPIYNALKQVHPNLEDSDFDRSKNKIILMSPKGEKFIQKTAREYCNLNSITFICGRYEGVDARVEHYCTDIISVGDYVLSGGELASLVISQAVTRLLPNVIENKEATDIESFENETLEYPQYTRPFDFKGKKVPEVLISGDHSKIQKWREDNSKDIKEK